jgi:HSP20 family protein
MTQTARNERPATRTSERNVLARSDPLAEFERMVSQLTRFPDSWEDLASARADGFIPLADVEETDDAYMLEVELSGVDKKDIDISSTGRRLTITGERKEKERTGVLRRRTRSVGRFVYDIQLPGEIDDKNITATLRDGVLTVRVPKASNAQARHIEVK